MYRFPSKSFSVRGRRSFLQFSALGGAATMLPALGSLENPGTANGSPDPYPIPWLDKNGSHNQPAGPNLDHRISITLKDWWRAAVHSLAWERIIKGIGSHSAAQQPTMA